MAAAVKQPPDMNNNGKNTAGQDPPWHIRGRAIPSIAAGYFTSISV